jgi:hypothetical protein
MELALLQQAQSKVRLDPTGALQIVDREAQRRPSSGFAQEREMIAIEALVRLGRVSEARARAGRFAHAFPGSAYRPRIEALLGFDAGEHGP